MSRESGLSKQVQFALNPMADRHFHKLKVVLPARMVFPQEIVPDRFHCISLSFSMNYGSGVFVSISVIFWLLLDDFEV